jgi:hypothetical protein
MKRWAIVSLLAMALAAAASAAPAGAAEGSFGIEAVESWLRDAGEGPDLQAGAHANYNATFTLTSKTNLAGESTANVANPRDVEVTLPPGLVGDPQATSKCSHEEFLPIRFAECSPEAQVGVATVTFAYQSQVRLENLAVYNLDPPPGVAAQFGFNILGVPTYIDAGVTADGEYHLTSTSRSISQGLNIVATSITLWGNPGSAAYEFLRTPKGGLGPTGEPVPGPPYERPFMSNPTSCPGTSLETKFQADAWRAPGAYSELSTDTDPAGNPLVITGCERVPFGASMTAQPTTNQAESPTGLDVTVELPQTELPEGLRSSDLREAVVTLPEGMTINPASAGGLDSCTEAQIGLGSDSEPTCPPGSRIGSLQVKSPLLEEELTGSVFLARQGQNKFGSLLALYLVIEDPARGVLVKVPGKVELDPSSGRLVTTFEDTPQLPISTLHVTFLGGPRAALMTPSACGTYTTTGVFSPWSGTAPITASDSFRITSGPEGSACPSGGFDPRVEAGTANPAAAQYSPLELRIARPDGSQRLGAVAVTLPKGMLANLSGIPYCPDAALAAIPTAEGSAAAEFGSPSCPAASRVGSVAVSAGAGSNPFWEKTGSAYLAGPYKGAPLSLAIVTPALAGPFDLGNVVVRTALQVDPATAVVTAQSDPLPTILHGVPLDLRELRVTLDRADFTLNPTSCAAGEFATTIASVAGAVAHPRVPFAATSCAGLGFAPKLSLQLKGGTRRGAFPALRATLKAPPGQANIGRVSVALPHSEFLEQGHIGTVCTRVQFAADSCPARSVYGYARAFTPLLSEPLEGPVYLRSSNHKLPDLVAVLAGQIDIELDGRIDSVHGGIRTTFESVPDAPVSKFVMNLQGGKKSLLVNSADTCSGNHRALVRMVGQNGKGYTSRPQLTAGCGKKK